MKEGSVKATERGVMSASVEAANLLREIAGKGEPGETKKAAWLRAYRRLSGTWTYNRVKDLWRCEPRARVSAEELTELRRVARTKSAGADDAILARLEQVERMLAALAERYPEHADFYSAQSHSLRGTSRRVGGKDTAE